MLLTVFFLPFEISQNKKTFNWLLCGGNETNITVILDTIYT